MKFFKAFGKAWEAFMRWWERHMPHLKAPQVRAPWIGAVWLVLRVVEDLPYEDIARALGIPTGTVMSRLSRGRQLLRKQLADFATREGITRCDSRPARGRLSHDQL